MSHGTAVSAASCRNCGAPLVGSYCHACGEPGPDPHEFAARHFVHDAVHEFLHLDGKIFRTLWLLIARAGFLTKEYWDGRRKAYIRPLRLYIFIAAIHAIAMSHSFYTAELFKSQGGTLQRIIERVSSQTHKSPAEVEEALNARIAKVYPVAQYFAVLGFALVPWILYRRARPFYIQHLIFSLHVYAFYFLLTAAVSLFLTPEQWRRSPLPVVSLIYIWFAIRLLYGERWLKSIGKAILLRAGLFLAEFLVLGLALTIAITLLQTGH